MQAAGIPLALIPGHDLIGFDTGHPCPGGGCENDKARSHWQRDRESQSPERVSLEGTPLLVCLPDPRRGTVRNGKVMPNIHVTHARLESLKAAPGGTFTVRW